MATGTKTAKGFQVTCPFCGDADSTINLDLNNLKSCTCSSCDEEFSPVDALAKAAELAAKWDRVVKWVAMANQAD